MWGGGGVNDSSVSPYSITPGISTKIEIERGDVRARGRGVGER